MHQVGFTQPHPAIQHQRIEGDRPALADPARRRMGQFVGLADHECVEGKPRIQRCRMQRRFHLVLARFGDRLDRRGFRLGRHRTAGPRLRVGRDLEQQALHGLSGRIQFVQDKVGKVLPDIVADEIGGNVENSNTILQLGEFERLYPCRVIVLSDSLEQPLPEKSPFFLCHRMPHAF